MDKVREALDGVMKALDDIRHDAHCRGDESLDRNCITCLWIEKHTAVLKQAMAVLSEPDAEAGRREG